MQSLYDETIILLANMPLQMLLKLNHHKVTLLQNSFDKILINYSHFLSLIISSILAFKNNSQYRPANSICWNQSADAIISTM